MAQFARPSSDVTFTLLGATPTNTADNRYTNIDESTPSDTDYVYSQNNPGGSGLAEFGLSSITDPGVDTGFVLRIRCAQIDEDSGTHPQSANTSGTATSLAWELRQGASLIEGGSISPGVFATTTVNLSSANVANITNFADLRVFVNPSGGGGSGANRRAVAISWIELEAPDASGGTQYNSSPSGSLSFTGAVAKAVSRALTGALSFAGSVTKRTSRSQSGSLDFSAGTVKVTQRGNTATITFTGALDSQVVTPALVIIHFHTE